MNSQMRQYLFLSRNKEFIKAVGSGLGCMTLLGTCTWNIFGSFVMEYPSRNNKLPLKREIIENIGLFVITPLSALIWVYSTHRLGGYSAGCLRRGIQYHKAYKQNF